MEFPEYEKKVAKYKFSHKIPIFQSFWPKHGGFNTI